MKKPTLKDRNNEQEILSRQYRAVVAQWRQTTIDACEDPQAMQSILAWLKRAGPDDGQAIVDTIEQAKGLFKGRQSHLLLLEAVDLASQRIRRKMKLPPIDDPFPPELNVFLECREIMR